jgi:hypothetical protein
MTDKIAQGVTGGALLSSVDVSNIGLGGRNLPVLHKGNFFIFEP